MIVGIFSPAPLIIISLKRGVQVGLISTSLVFMALLMTIGVQQALFFFTEYAVLAIIMAETLRIRLSFDKCVLFSVLGSTVLSGFLLILIFSGKDVSLTEFLKQQVETHFEQSLEAFKTVEQEELDSAAMEKFVEKVSRSFAVSYPAIIFVGSLIGAVVNFSITRWVMQRYYSGAHFFSGCFSVWVLPEFFIWFFIFSAGSLLLSEGQLGNLGLNLFVISAMLYLLQGMAIVIHFLEKKNVLGFLWVIVFFCYLFTTSAYWCLDWDRVIRFVARF